MSFTKLLQAASTRRCFGRWRVSTRVASVPAGNNYAPPMFSIVVRAEDMVANSMVTELTFCDSTVLKEFQ
ncbi:MAG: hypothetical protein KC432_02390 [Thermomicrobiales bacterium]|nr:hypothetical protein [Thermomicrobiales bacterium]